ncbi:hypothetical protein DM02DRAFT_608630 [Periconia macrospinosa]|uniref:Uncharacterized protein n=1 Tax=Periconia macrospinosa TaxID=97972 RepID=A0A2V1ECY0_9PLEO|nr:hypothetical protein DM02DRAFT_608630 [Periconia macrospinosa]
MSQTKKTSFTLPQRPIHPPFFQTHLPPKPPPSSDLHQKIKNQKAINNPTPLTYLYIHPR